VLSVGHPGNLVVKAIQSLEKEGFTPAHFDLRFIKPLDESILHDVFARFKKIITVEDGTIVGGFGSAVVEFMVQNNYSSRVKMLGIPDEFIEHGTQRQLYRECGFDPESIANAVREIRLD
jgi:1-deoxy-D-xylulose-5-phosphate synthase